MSHLEIFDSEVLVLAVTVGYRTAPVGLGAVGVLDALNINSRRGKSNEVVPSLELEVHECSIVVERETNGSQVGLCGVGLTIQRGILVEIAQSLLVLVDGKVKLLVLESFVAVLLAVEGDLENILGIKFLVVVFGEVLVGVAGRIRLAGIRSLVALELATVGDQNLLERVITR